MSNTVLLDVRDDAAIRAQRLAAAKKKVRLLLSREVRDNLMLLLAQSVLRLSVYRPTSLIRHLGLIFQTQITAALLGYPSLSSHTDHCRQLLPTTDEKA